MINKYFLFSLILFFTTVNNSFSFDIRIDIDSKIASKSNYIINDTNLVDSKNAKILLEDLKLIRKISEKDPLIKVLKIFTKTMHQALYLLAMNRKGKL